ncbi:hypothetical protein [Kineosporia sp. R_H_3]|uniref:hypothetical protein n=1 Tax=Kineosporia sp. R_H_3 TaxID=1961848 RepID=UPI000B4BB89B|nr:hypothetical protein [Kineosporia sp. R_H_3]
MGSEHPNMRPPGRAAEFPDVYKVWGVREGLLFGTYEGVDTHGDTTYSVRSNLLTATFGYADTYYGKLTEDLNRSARVMRDFSALSLLLRLEDHPETTYTVQRISQASPLLIWLTVTVPAAAWGIKVAVDRLCQAANTVGDTRLQMSQRRAKRAVYDAVADHINSVPIEDLMPRRSRNSIIQQAARSILAISSLENPAPSEAQDLLAEPPAALPLMPRQE